MSSTACFVIVSRNDSPIFESEVGTAPKVLSLAHCAILRNREGKSSLFFSCQRLKHVDDTICAYISRLFALLFGMQKDEAAHLHQFILHASLDIVQDVVWNTNNMYDCFANSVP